MQMKKIKVVELERLSKLIGELAGVVGFASGRPGGSDAHTRPIIYNAKSLTNFYESLCIKYNVKPSEITIDLRTGKIKKLKKVATPKPKPRTKAPKK